MKTMIVYNVARLPVPASQMHAMTSTAVYRRLKMWIYRGQLPPGQRLIETQLAGRLGTSRIPLRESLRRLESEGLVRSIPNTATFVAELSPDDIREILFMRKLLEPPAARLASQHGTPRLFAYLHRLAQRMGTAAKEDQLPLLHQLDSRFHHAIVKGSRCSRLLRAYESCHIQIVGPRVGFEDLKWETGELTEQLHCRLADLIAAGQGEAAERFAREVLDRSIAAADAYYATPDRDSTENHL